MPEAMLGEEPLSCDRFSVLELTKESKLKLATICLFTPLFVEAHWCVVYSGLRITCCVAEDNQEDNLILLSLSLRCWDWD